MSDIDRQAAATVAKRAAAPLRGGELVVVIAVALAAALLHWAPHWHAVVTTPEGWEFTGNLQSSPDAMQYRLWMRQTAEEGAIVGNRFTGESHRPFLPVTFYWILGALARAFDSEPEWVLVAVGSLLAAALALLLEFAAREFVAERRHRWWIVGALLLGGGLGAYLKLAKAVAVRWLADPATTPVGALVAPPTVSWLLAEDYRGHYLFSTLFDGHYLMVWIGTLAALLALHRALVAPSAARTALAAALFALATILHLYEGVTLTVIAWCAVALWRAKGLPCRRAVRDAALCTAAAGLVLAFFLALQVRSGLPMPRWSAFPMPLSLLVIAHPLAWALIAWGARRYWAAARPHELFLLAWAMGCTLVTQSGPFYPYPDRGAMTLQIPLYLIGGTIFFRRLQAVSGRSLTVAIVLLGATPVFLLGRQWQMGEFSAAAPHKWLSADARATIEQLRQRAGAQDLLLAEPSHARWLAAEHPGRHYVAHFFLTVDFERKQEEYEQFCAGSGIDRPAFLAERGIRFVYLLDRCRPPTAVESSAWRLLNEDRYGALYESSVASGS